MNMKKYLTREEEFAILKLVLDKFLWGGLIVLLYGLYKLESRGVAGLADSLYIIGAGVIIFILFIVLLVREYEVTKHP